MAFIQYSRILKSIGLKSATCESTSLKIPLNTDNVFLLQTNNEYQVYRISSNELLYKGLIPKQFVASQYIEPLNRLRQNCIYLVNSQASVCKVNYRENGIEIHHLAAPEKVQNPGSLCLEFKILDEAGDYLLGFAKNVENMSTVLFIYDWVNKIYSNFVNLGTGFFNCIVSNLSQQISFIKNSQTTKPPEFQFLVVGQEDKKVCYKYITVQSYENSTQMQTKNHGIRFILKQSVKRLISNEYCPRGVYLLYPYMFLIANSKDGPILVQTNIEENASNRIDLKTGLKQEKGIIRQYFGIIDGNIIFTIHSIKRRSQQLCKISFSPQNIHSIKSPIQCLKLINIENNTMGQIKNRLESVRKSIDGLSFHRYNFQLESLGQELVKQNPDFEVKLQIETIIRIGKKYFYQEMAEQLHFPPALINQMISLL